MDNPMRDVIEQMKNTAQREGKQQTSGLSRVHRQLYDGIVEAFNRQGAAVLNLDLFDLEEMTDRLILVSDGIDELSSRGLINAKLIGVYTWEMSLPQVSKEGE